MKVLVTGANGQLGFDVVRELKEQNIKHLGIDINELDITNEQNVRLFISNYKPTHIIHCAAYTAVDKAEEEKELAYNINVNGTKYLAEAAKIVNSKFLYISTDYVFDGKGKKPFKNNDEPNPVNYYGETKYLGEQIVKEIFNEYFIVRISWVFGLNGHNFVKTMLRLAETNKELNVVSDQVGSPTNTYDLSKVLIEMIKNNDYGIHHVTNDGFTSWYEFAIEIFKIAKKDVKVNSLLTKDYKTLAKRPLNSRMKKSKYKMIGWKESLNNYIKELEKNGR